jgi:Tfp pilus assembly protein PilF
MKKPATGAFVIASLFCLPLPAQDRIARGASPPVAANWEQIVHADRNVDVGDWSTGVANSQFSPPLISAATLAHNPSKGARREFDRGVRAWRKGEGDQAVQHLAEAVRLDPDFIDALNELGFVYVKTGHPELALGHLQRAVTLMPNLAVLQTNYAAALVDLGRPVEAEAVARRALQLDARSVQANHLLGVALMMQMPASTREHGLPQN